MAFERFTLWCLMAGLGVALPLFATDLGTAGTSQTEHAEPALHDALMALDRQSQGALDTASIAQLKQLLDGHDWPSAAQVGRDGVDAAGRLIEHASGDKDFQHSMLRAMRIRVGIDIDAAGYAALCDRIAVSQGDPQLYGTQLAIKGGKVVTSPSEDIGNATEYRDSIGLSYMDAYLKQVQTEVDRGRPLAGITRAPRLSMEPRWPTQPALRQELRDMFKADQQARRAFVEAGMKQNSPEQQAVIEVDKRNIARVRDIIGRYGFPDAAMVGRQGVSLMLILADHIEDDDALMGHVLELSRPLLDKGELSHALYATVTDRHLVLQHKPQIYGSQTELKQGHSVPLPLIDPDQLDARRAAMGMEPEADYLKENDAAYQADSNQSTH